MFFAFFGGAWLLNGYALARGSSPMLVVLLTATTLILFLTAFAVARKQRDALRAARETAESRRARKQFLTINATQWVAAIAAVVVPHQFGHDAWAVPAVMLVVGLHFLPLARVFRYRPHYLTGAALILTAILYPFASQNGPGSAAGSIAAAWAIPNERPIALA